MPEDSTSDRIRAQKVVSEKRDGAVGDRMDERFEERLAETRRIVDLKVLLATARDHDLSDDPAVKTLEEQVATLQEHAEFVDLPPKTRLSEEYGLRESALSRLDDEEIEELANHLESIREHENADQLGDLRERELKRRHGRVEAILKSIGIKPSSLFSNASESGQLEAALSAAEADSDPLAEIDGTASESVRAAQLREKKADLQERIQDEESNLATIQLQEELDTVEAELAEVEGGGSDDSDDSGAGGFDIRA